MEILEKELEDYLIENDNLIKIGIDINKNSTIINQVELAPYGIADIVVFNKSPNNLMIYIIELKKKRINLDALLQVIKYGEGIKKYFEQGIDKSVEYQLRLNEYPPYIEYYYYLIGEKISPGDWVYLINIIDNINLFTYEISLESGITLKEHGRHWYKKGKYPDDFNKKTFDLLLNLKIDTCKLFNERNILNNKTRPERPYF